MLFPTTTNQILYPALESVTIKPLISHDAAFGSKLLPVDTLNGFASLRASVYHKISHLKPLSPKSIPRIGNLL
jgi:hypothetical protein